MADLSGLWGEKTQQEMAEEARGGFVLLAPGWHTTVIKKAELKDTQSGGKMLVVDFENDATARFNIKNASQKAEMIGRQQLAKCATEAGVKNLTDSAQLHGMPVDIKVTVEKFVSNTNGKELESNNIVDFAKAGTKANASAAKATGAATTNSAPW